MVIDFFKNLLRYRVESVRMRVNEKVTNVQTRAKSQASKKFNEAIDKPMNKAKAKAKNMQEKANQKGQAKEKPKQRGAPKQQARKQKQENSGGNMFGRKKNEGRPQDTLQDSDEDFEGGLKTQAIDLSDIVDDRSQDVVGWIVCLNSSLRGRDFRLITGRNVMGTAADCDIVLTDPYLSSKHVVIRHENGRFMLIDLDSTNGTYVNDRRVNKQELIDNDKIRIGRTEMKFKSLF